VAVNEETNDGSRNPGRAAITSTVVLLITYVIVSTAAQSFAGIGTKGIGLQNRDNSGDVLSVLGGQVFGTNGFGWFLGKLLVLMVLSSAAASTLTTILPTARTSLAMAAYRSIPSRFARIHRRYYGLTGIVCARWFRRELRRGGDLLVKGLLPLFGGLVLWAFLGYGLYEFWQPSYGSTSWTLPFSPHWHIGGVFLTGAGALVLGVILMLVYRVVSPAFFKGRTLNKETPVLVPEST
jgi:hypothetical protein